MVHGPDRLNGGGRITPFRVVAVVAVVLAGLLVTGLLPVELVRVSSVSMAPTLHAGDRVLLVHDTGGLRRGDLVALSDPDGSGLLVKRVLALGGDRFAIEDGVVVVNGAAVVEPYADQSRIDGVYAGPLPVPRGSVYVLGDNRGESVDSLTFGPAPEDSVVGRVTFRLWPSPGRL
ncbi:signal peptidase I [Pseudonocardia aurantiaca]